MRVNLLREIEIPVRSMLDRHRRLVLAVSGGIDSAVLLDAVARLRSPEHRVVVATLDHGTGETATDAAALTAATAAGHGLPVVTERLRPSSTSEAEWRARRWHFLRTVAGREHAVVATAHTRDDQVETVVMRLLRGAGARGLAGLYAATDVQRPLLSASRTDVIYYAGSRSVRFVDDPSNLSVSFLRNRVRLNLLPAIRAVHPGFDNEVLDLAHRAAQLRADVDALAETLIVEYRRGEVSVGTAALAALDEDGRRLLWPSFAARAGIRLDRRGIVRLAGLNPTTVGSRVQVSGGFEVTVSRTSAVLKRHRVAEPRSPRSIRGGASFGPFRFERVPVATIKRDSTERDSTDGDPWRIRLDDSAEPLVREWQPGDRLRLGGGRGRRRVKRFLAEAGIPGPERRGWPVVVVDDDVVWIPGVRASDDAAAGTGSPVEYRCERNAD